MTGFRTSVFRIVLLAAALCLSIAQARPKDDDLRLEVSSRWAEKGEYEKAVQELRLYLSENPESPEIYARIGFLRMKQGNFKLAGENYKIALAKNPNLREAREGLVMAYEKSGDKAKADEERRKLGQAPRGQEPPKDPHDPADHPAAHPIDPHGQGPAVPGPKPPSHQTSPPAGEHGAAPKDAGAKLAPAQSGEHGAEPINAEFSPALDSGTSTGAEGIYAQKEFLEAMELYRKGKTDAMAGALRRCLSKTPGHPGAYYLGGVMRYEKGELGKALFNFKRATDYPDRGFNSWFYMGLIAERQEREADAAAAFEKYLKLTRSEAGRKQAEAHLARLKGNPPATKADAHAESEKDAHGKKDGTKDGEKAEGREAGHGDEHGDGHGEGTENAVPPVDEGQAAAAALTPADAAKAMVMGKDGSFFFIIPDNASPSGKKLNEAYELCKKERFEKAVNTLKETVLQFGGSENADAANLDLASVYLQLGLWENARDRIVDYIGGAPRDSVRYYDPAQYLTALALLGLKDGEKAEKALLRIKAGAANGPSQEEIDYRLAQAGELMKDSKKWSAYLEKAFASAKDPVRKATLAQRQGYLFAKYGNLDKAMEHFPKSMGGCKDAALAEICAESQLRLADMLFRKKAWKESMDQYRQFASKYPNHKESAWVHYQMANIYKSTSNFESALNEYKRVIDNYPDSYWASQAKWKREDTIWRKEYEEVLD